MNLDTKTIGIIAAIVMQTISIVWFISKMDSKVQNNYKEINEIWEIVDHLEMHEKQIDRLTWLLEEDSKRK